MKSEKCKEKNEKGKMKSESGDCIYCLQLSKIEKMKSGNESEIVFTVKQREGEGAVPSFQKLEWVDEKLSKVNKANKAGNIQNCGKALK